MLRFSKIAFAVAALCLIAPLSARAEGPCQRGANQAQLGGIDLDVVRCQMLFLQQQLGAQQFEITALRAKLELLGGDLAKAKAEPEQNKPAPASPPGPQ